MVLEKYPNLSADEINLKIDKMAANIEKHDKMEEKRINKESVDRGEICSLIFPTLIVHEEEDEIQALILHSDVNCQLPLPKGRGL